MTPPSLVGPAVATNVNVGVLGHVDSGKTSLVRALSTQLSTAALDKNPQSQQRGMTLDLGFSALQLSSDAESQANSAPTPALQVTLVDCPGHASLFKTILGGVAIIDTVLLVVDARRGLQPQTVESLLLTALMAERRVLVALTKTDLLPEPEVERSAALQRVTEEIRGFLTRHLPRLGSHVDVPVVPVSVVTGSGLQELLQALRVGLEPPQRDVSGAFRLAIDHCFAVPGNGTVFTGTALSGTLRLEDELELLPLGTTVRVKALQVFKREVESCGQGDRVAVRVNGLDPTLVERALGVAPPGSLAPVTQVVLPVSRVSFYRGPACRSGTKLHATVGHTTVQATATFFSRLGQSHEQGEKDTSRFDPQALYEYVAELASVRDAELHDDDTTGEPQIFVLLQFELPVFCPPEELVVCSRLELDAKRNPCRLAFYGAVQAVVGCDQDELRALQSVHSCVADLSDLRIGRIKTRGGVLDKLLPAQGNREAIGRDMFSKDVGWSVYQGSLLLLEDSRVLGSIVAPFGKAGKFRIALQTQETAGSVPSPGERLELRFLKLVTLKPPKLKLKGGMSAKVAKPGTKAKTSAKKNASRALLQDARLLYPEAFTVSVVEATTAVQPTTAVKSPGAIQAVQTVETAVEKEVATQLVAGEGSPNAHVATKTGTIERLKGETTADGRNPFAVVCGLFESEHDAKQAVGRRVRCRPKDSKDGQIEEQGEIEKPFGKAGKVRVSFEAAGGTRGQPGDFVELC